LRSHLGNGYTKKLSNEITKELFELIKMMSENNHTIRTTETTTESQVKISTEELKRIKFEKRVEFLTKLVTTGGVAYLLLDKLL
jgi:hypothetical protein